MNKLFTVALPAVALFLAACSTSPVFSTGRIDQSKGYPGPEKAEGEVATVFATDAGPRYDATHICTVNYRALERPGCVNVVYLAPGSHTLGWQYKGTTATGAGHLGVVVEAGRVYQLNASSLGDSRGVVQLIPMPAGSKVTYRNVRPSKIPPGVNADDVLPYGAN